jgi:hypothetical protein
MEETEMSNLLKANNAYNKELRKYIKKDLPSNTFFNLGQPIGKLSELLNSSQCIMMRQGILKKAIKGHEAPINLNALEDLPLKLHSASLFFKSKQQENSIIIAPNIRDSKNNPVVIPISINAPLFINHQKYTVNLITSIYGKSEEKIELWRQQNLEIASKDKTFTYSEQLSPILSAGTDKGFKDTSNVTPKSETTKTLAEKNGRFNEKKYL